MPHYETPDLSRIPREAWFEALSRVDTPTRNRAAWAVPEDLRGEAYTVAAEVLIAHGDGPRRPQVAKATPELPTPEAPARRPDRRGRQVNVRLRHDDHARLCIAAELVGLAPTELARAFMVDGTRRLLSQREPS